MRLPETVLTVTRMLAKLHTQAGVMLSRPWAFETIVMAVLLEHEKRIGQLLHQLQAARATLISFAPAITEL
jgi:hypothetical protein